MWRQALCARGVDRARERDGIKTEQASGSDGRARCLPTFREDGSPVSVVWPVQSAQLPRSR